jgi:hypothetical protein
MERCREVGESFEAVAPPTLNVEQGELAQLDSRNAKQATTDDSILSMISQPKDENARMKDELELRAYEARLEADARNQWGQ